VSIRELLSHCRSGNLRHAAVPVAVFVSVLFRIVCIETELLQRGFGRLLLALEELETFDRIAEAIDYIGCRRGSKPLGSDHLNGFARTHRGTR
jgi:hypothetical protein